MENAEVKAAAEECVRNIEPVSGDDPKLAARILRRAANMIDPPKRVAKGNPERDSLVRTELQRLGAATVPALSAITGLHPRAVYTSFQVLVEAGEVEALQGKLFHWVGEAG